MIDNLMTSEEFDASVKTNADLNSTNTKKKLNQKMNNQKIVKQNQTNQQPGEGSGGRQRKKRMSRW